MAKTTPASAQQRSVTVTLKRSAIGTPVKQRRVLEGLGLRKIRQTVVRPDTPQVWGMIKKVSHLLEVKVE